MLHCKWSVDGKFILTATLSPHLWVGIKIGICLASGMHRVLWDRRERGKGARGGRVLVLVLGSAYSWARVTCTVLCSSFSDYNDITICI